MPSDRYRTVRPTNPASAWGHRDVTVTCPIRAPQNVPAAALSGGQRSRVALAAVSFGKPHVLILDEVRA